MAKLFETIKRFFTDQSEPNAAKQVISETKFLAFDLEISKTLIEDFSQWKAHRPLGISCAATMLDGEQPRLWFSREKDQRIAKQMNLVDLAVLVNYLQETARQGSQILTWNGLGFDFDVLAEECECWTACRELALNHTDMMFHFFCLQGYPLGLNKAAKGMGLPGKTEGMSGELAPELWQQGQHELVLKYVAQDVRTTLAVAKSVLSEKCIAWTSNSGKPQRVMLPHGWLTVQQAIQLPLPDSSWMNRPMKRSEFLAWTKAENKRTASVKIDPVSPPLVTQSPSSQGPFGQSGEELSADEINAIFENDEDCAADEVILQQLEDELKEQSNPSSDRFLESGCPCAICRGVPNEDFIFQMYEKQ